jgi:AraC-like DNA-binding protein
MPTVIRDSLFRKVAQLTDFLQFRLDFEIATGVPVAFLPVEDAVACPSNVEVPVRVSGITIGNLRAAHIEPHRSAACARLLELAAREIALRVTAHIPQPSQALPDLIETACRVTRERACKEDLRLTDIAASCGVSVSHLSRAFHHATGLTFRQYVARFRLERAFAAVTTTATPITQIAFDAGFQSLSQFHRVFRAAYDRSPRQIRAEHKPSVTPIAPSVTAHAGSAGAGERTGAGDRMAGALDGDAHAAARALPRRRGGGRGRDRVG